MKFNYQARTKTGEIRVGQIEASSEDAAAVLLQRYGLYITFLEEAVAPIYAKRVKLFERVSHKDIVLFSRQLAILFRAQVPLVESLRVLATQTKSRDFREKLLKISEEVEGGTVLSKTLSRYPKFFTSFYIAVVKAGEASGSLSESLNYLADHLEREYHLAAKTKGAMIYPVLILVVVVAVLALMMFFVIPNLVQVLETSNTELPTPTKVIIGLSDFIRNWAWLVVLVIIGVIGLAVSYYRTESGKKFFDKLVLRLPLIGPFLKLVYLTRFAENLTTLIAGGLPITQALETVADIIGNTSYKKVIFETKEEVKKGEQISSVLAKAPELFTPLFVQMTLVGEKTGTLDKTLINVVNFYQKEIDRTVDNILNIIEPALIIFLGLVVGGIMLSILMPLYKVVGNV